jgi:hypothetical protein
MVLRNDVENSRAMVDHVTTFHLVLSDWSAICLVLAPGLIRCYETRNFDYHRWPAFYLAAPLKSDLLPREDENGFGQYLHYFGKSRDQHVDTKQASVEFDMYSCGPLTGIVKNWNFYLPFSCDVQAFKWAFNAYVLGTPDAAWFQRPPFMSAGTLPLYSTFAANFACAVVPPPPAP